jgi:phytoene/squalene synthetase
LGSTMEEEDHPHRARDDDRFGYCLDLLRRYDHDQFLVNLVQPRNHRRAHAALRALNIELARIRHVVTNEDLGRLRIDFFRQGLERAFTATTTTTTAIPKQTPVLDLVSETIAQFALSQQWFDRLLSARVRSNHQPHHYYFGSEKVVVFVCRKRIYRCPTLRTSKTSSNLPK